MAKKIEKQSELVSMDVFYRDLLLVFGCESDVRRELSRYYKKEEIDELLKNFTFTERGRTVYTSKFNAFFVWLPEKPKTAQDVGFLVHELFHSTCAIMKNMGVGFSDDSEEAYAYTIGFLTEKVLQRLPTFSCHAQ